MIKLDENRMTSLVKAKAVLHMAELKPLAEDIGISCQVIENYRSKPDLLNKASWVMVETLAQIYDGIKSGTFDSHRPAWWSNRHPERWSGMPKSIREREWAAAAKKRR